MLQFCHGCTRDSIADQTSGVVDDYLRVNWLIESKSLLLL